MAIYLAVAGAYGTHKVSRIVVSMSKCVNTIDI